MKEGRIPKKTLAGHFGGRRMTGRLRVQWEEVFKCNARTMLDVRNWRTTVRHGWMRSLRRP